jgi:hypothetical protein
MAHKLLVKDTTTNACGLADPIKTLEVVSGSPNVLVVLGGTPTAPTATIAVSDLDPAEVVTTLVDNGNGTITYTNEAGTAVTIALCALMSGLPNVGPLQA